MAYDAARQRIVLFGGASSSSRFSDTWEWDGATWTQRTPAASPPARSGHALAYDSARQRVVLFGGEASFPMSDNLSDTWEWDGATWTERNHVASPRAQAVPLVYDGARQRIIVFGGFGNGNAGGNTSETWEWDGATWTRRAPAASPPGRFGHVMAYDDARQRVVLFGGSRRNMVQLVRLTDTWEWDGTTWTERTPAASPPVSTSHAMAYDVARQRIVLFGGSSDTWEWDGTTWTQRTPASSPPGRIGHFLAYDAARQRVVLFGGAYGNSCLSDTWEWDGAAWTPRNPANSPRESCFDYNLAYDAARQRVVYVGRSQTNNTWEWDGTTWTQRNPADPPSGQGALAYDVARQRLTFFNGTDTWVLLP
jgi:hypothetical protein